MSQERFIVISRSLGFHVLDNRTGMLVVGPFALRKIAQDAADKRNSQHHREVARRSPQ